MLSNIAIRSDESNFFRRYGLRDWEPLITIRCLDYAIQRRLQLPCAEASVPLEYLDSADLAGVRLLVVENLTNLRTLPAVPNGLVIFGMGNAAVNLRPLKILASSSVAYWGDLDIYGLKILSQYRQLVGRATSVFMDIETLNGFRSLMTPRDYKTINLPPQLTDAEAEAFNVCNDLKLQLEQERIPQSAVVEWLSG